MTAPIAIAFTGARTGLTPAQRTTLRDVLAGYPGSVMHNGAAIGADEEALHLWPFHRPAHLWPCSKDREEWANGWASGTDELVTVHERLPPLTRNARMVAAASVVIACPDGPERTRSETWSTVREGRRTGRAIVLVWPSGEVTREEAP